MASLDIPAEAELTDLAKVYDHAWAMLGSDRPRDAEGGAGRIPWSAIASYAACNGIDDDEGLARMLWAMDDVYLAWLGEERKRRQRQRRR